MPLFRLIEYAEAEARFVYEAIDALSRARGGVVGLVSREPARRTGTTQFTTDEGSTVELQSVEIGTPITLGWEEIIAGNVDAFLTVLDEAAEQHHEQLSRYIFESLDVVTSSTGNQVDGTGKSFFDSLYEMFDKVELWFEPDGQISKGFAFVVHPDNLEVMKQKEAELTTDERRQLDELIDRKREEFFARRRRRKLS